MATSSYTLDQFVYDIKELQSKGVDDSAVLGQRLFFPGEAD